MNTLVVIPARGGSKGLPGKNIKRLNNKPLIHYTIEAAREVFDDPSIIISTDDPQIKESAEQTGIKVPFLRPEHLATDTAATADVLLHALEFVEKNNYFPKILILLQPTSPLRNSRHIKEAMKLYKTGVDMVVSVKETKSNPYYVLFEENSNGFLEKCKNANFLRRQDCPKVWEYNGAIYIINVAQLKEKKSLQFEKVIKYVMDEKSSQDIDTPFDWKIVELLINE